MDGLFPIRPLPPANLQAEQALLGALLANNQAHGRVDTFLLPEHFADPVHRTIYKAVSELIESGQLVDVVTLKSHFEGTGKLDEVGGTAYLAKLLTAMVGIINAGEYGRAIFEAAQRREMIDIGETVVNRSYSGDEDPAEIAMEAASALDSIAVGTVTKPVFTAGSAVAAAISRSQLAYAAGGFLGLRTGFQQFDEALGGLERERLYYLAGRPGMGKTAALLGLARGVAQQTGEPVFIWSGEMGAAQLGMRMLSMDTAIPIEVLRSGSWQRPGDKNNPLEQRQLAEWTAKIGDAALASEKEPLSIDDRAALTLQQIALAARATKRANGGRLGAIFIDYLQLMKAPREIERHGNTSIATYNSQALKALAKSLEVPIVCLSQLNRDVEKRENKRPMLSDLRESGALEQDGDAVIFLYRHEYYVEKEKPSPIAGDSESDFQNAMDAWEERMRQCAGKAEWIIAKWRDGPTKTLPMEWDGPHTSFRDLGPDFGSNSNYDRWEN